MLNGIVFKISSNWLLLVFKNITGVLRVDFAFCNFAELFISSNSLYMCVCIVFRTFYM